MMGLNVMIILKILVNSLVPWNPIHFLLKYNLWKISTKVYLTRLVSWVKKHQAKGYNNRQTEGIPFEIGDKCLKCNCKDDGHKAKLCRCLLGPYTVVGKSGANAYYLMDHYSHKLTWSVPRSQLVHFYEKEKYKGDG